MTTYRKGFEEDLAIDDLGGAFVDPTTLVAQREGDLGAVGRIDRDSCRAPRLDDDDRLHQRDPPSLLAFLDDQRCLRIGDLPVAEETDDAPELLAGGSTSDSIDPDEAELYAKIASQRPQPSASPGHRVAASPGTTVL